MAPRLVRHRGAKIVARLRKFGGLVDLVRLEGLLDPTQEEPASWYQQGWVLLDAADSIRTQVITYEGAAAMRRKGERGTVAWGYLIQHRRQWGLSPRDLAALLARAEFVRDDPHHVAKLADSVRRHDERRT